jgi:hypothetical protein
MQDYAPHKTSSGTAKAALATAIPAAALTLLNLANETGGTNLKGILGGNSGGSAPTITVNDTAGNNGLAGMATGAALGMAIGRGGFGFNGNCNCNEDHVATRYDLANEQALAAKDAKIAALEVEVKFRDANIYTDSKIADVYERLTTKIDNKVAAINEELKMQAVYNATNTATIGCMENQIQQLLGMTKMVIPNTSVCPGWGNVTITPATTTTTTA